MPKNRDVAIVREAEIQYDGGSAEHLSQIREWLLGDGGKIRKQISSKTTYYDTKNNRLYREGMEYRVRGGRHEMKVPADTKSTRVIVPDENAIFHRDELKCDNVSGKPRLSLFWGLAVLQPVQKRVKRFFDKMLRPKFIADFDKTKILRTIAVGGKKAVIEYSLQAGRLMDYADRKNRTGKLFLVEPELVSGPEEALLVARKELESLWPDLVPMEKTKVGQGFALLEKTMTDKQRRNYRETEARTDAARHALAPAAKAA